MDKLIALVSGSKFLMVILGLSVIALVACVIYVLSALVRLILSLCGKNKKSGIKVGPVSVFSEPSGGRQDDSLEPLRPVDSSGEPVERREHPFDKSVVSKIIHVSMETQQETMRLYDQIGSIRDMILTEQIDYAKKALDIIRGKAIAMYSSRLAPESTESILVSTQFFTMFFTMNFDAVQDDIVSVMKRNHFREKNEEEFSELIQFNGDSLYSKLQTSVLGYMKPIDCTLAEKCVSDLEPQFRDTVQDIFSYAKKMSVKYNAEIDEKRAEILDSQFSIIHRCFPDISLDELRKFWSEEKEL